MLIANHLRVGQGGANREDVTELESPMPESGGMIQSLA